jgi:hypothetical protein
MRPDLELLGRLYRIADAMVESRTTQISDQSIRILREEIAAQRRRISEEENLIGYEAVCLIECIAELAYARSDQHKPREDRAVMYINTLRVFLRGNHDIARRAIESATEARR